jgi:predicted dehydrogenase
MDKLRFGIMGGAASMAHQHRIAIYKNANSELIGMASPRSLEKCRELCEREKVRFYPTYDEMLADRDINAIAIATHHPSHCEYTLKALKAGKHVLCEKPMCVTVSEADRMVRAVKRAKTKFGIIYQFRFDPNMAKIKELVDSGALGAVYRTAMTYAIFRTDAYFKSGAWRATWEGEGGGIILNQASHLLDILLWTAGMPKRIYARTPTLRHDIEVEDCASALLEYANGAQGSVFATTCQMPGQTRLELCGENGRVVYEGGLTFQKLPQPLGVYQKTSQDMWGEMPNETQKFPPAPDVHDDDTLIPCFRDFIESVRERREPMVTAEQGRRAIEVSNAIILSHYKKKPVELPINRDEYDRLLARLIRQSKAKKK